MYACMYVSYTRGVEKKKKREKRNAGGKTSAIRKIELIFLPIDALLLQREKERVTSFRSLQSSAGKIAGKTIRALCKSRVLRGGTRSWEFFSRKFLSILGKTRLEEISRFFYIRYFYSTLSTKEVKESSFSGEKFQRNRAIR